MWRGSAALGVALVSLVFGGCSWLQSSPECTSGEIVLAESAEGALTCAALEPAEEYVELLAGRSLTQVDRGLLYEHLARAWRSDPETVRVAVSGAAEVVSTIRAKGGQEAAERRSTAAYEAITGEGPLAGFEDLETVITRALSVWERDDEERLVLTEADIEGWIRYGSLCREAQGAGTLTASIADRVKLYRIARDRFAGASRAEQIAMSFIGGAWWSLHERWPAASYERQQSWIRAAPLPPPMTSTSLGYFEAVLQTDVLGHARAVEQAFGPLSPQPAE